jgi:hypothetical protein
MIGSWQWPGGSAADQIVIGVGKERRSSQGAQILIASGEVLLGIAIEIAERR